MVAEARVVQRARESLERYIRQRGLKSTRQRDLVLQALAAAEKHVSVDELLGELKRVDPKISAATVYRTVRLLVDCGLASARQFGDGHTRYEIAGDRHHHDHLICTRCRTIIEFENDRIEQLQDLVARRHGFVVTQHKLELYGLCKTCRDAETQS